MTIAGAVENDLECRMIFAGNLRRHFPGIPVNHHATMMADQTLRRYAKAYLALDPDEEHLDLISSDLHRFSSALTASGPAEIDTEPVLDFRRRLLAAARA